MRGHVAVHDVLQPRDVDLAALVRWHVLDFVPGNHGRGRIGAVRGVGNQHFLARAPLRIFQIGANQQQSGEFALRSGGGFQRAGIHARDFGQAFQQQFQNLQAALREFLRLVGMLGGDAVQARDEFVHARVVLHRAGPQRVHAQIDRVIPGGQAREVAHHFDFADFREARHALTRVGRAQCGARVDLRNVQGRELHSALAGRGLLEDQSLVLADVPPRFFNSIGQCNSPGKLFPSAPETICSARLQAGICWSQAHGRLKAGATPVSTKFRGQPRPCVRFRRVKWFR